MAHIFCAYLSLSVYHLSNENIMNRVAICFAYDPFRINYQQLFIIGLILSGSVIVRGISKDWPHSEDKNACPSDRRVFLFDVVWDDISVRVDEIIGFPVSSSSLYKIRSEGMGKSKRSDITISIASSPPNSTFNKHTFKVLDGETTIISSSLSNNCSFRFEDCSLDVQLHFPQQNKNWNVEGSIRQGKGNLIIKTGASPAISLHTTKAPNKTHLAVHLLDGRQILNLNTESSGTDETHFHAELPILDLKARGTVRSSQDQSRATLTADNISSPSRENALHYRFSYSQNSKSPFVVLQHNISSNLYQFQGNLTVQSSEDDPGALVTSITQMTRCSVWDAINSDLRQVFHQQGHSYWENVVLRSPMVDMHVSGRWEESVTNFYRKQFDLHSRAEPLLPSATLNLEYSDSSRFMHRLKLPFLSATYELAIQLRQGSYLPQEIIITFQDHFLTNRTQPILQWMLLDDGLGTGRVRIKSQSHFQIMFTDMAGYVKQVSAAARAASADPQHPVNRLLSPILAGMSVAEAVERLSSLLSLWN